MQRAFWTEVLESGFIHKPLPLHTERSLEELIAQKEVLKTHTVWSNGTMEGVSASGSATVGLEEGAGVNGNTALYMKAPFRSEAWPDGIKSPAPYTNYSTARTHIKIDRENWEEYNRFSCRIKPDFPDNDNVHCIIAIYNDGKEKLPDKYWREGFHVVNLKNHVYNHVVWEFQDLPRDCVTEIIFYTFMKGYNGASGKEELYYFDDIAVEAVETPDHAKGWCPPYETVIYSTAGYDTAGAKTALITAKADRFCLKKEDGTVVYEGAVQQIENEKGAFGLLDFSDVTEEGVYRIEAGTVASDWFPVSKDVIEDAIWKTISYLFAQRCGYAVPGVHLSCHHDMFAEHDGKTLVFNGGWHDAGDMSQFAAQSMEITQSLFELAERMDPASQLALRLMEEGEWGLDFMLRTRFGDGYRATSVGAVRYTDNLIGTFDDIPTVRVHNHPLDNFISAAVLAHAGVVLKARDRGRADYIVTIAQEDYAFAMKEYGEKGYYPTEVRGEHTYPSGESQFYAYASIAASRLFAVTQKEEYAADARRFADLVLECQETGEAGIPISGFFYRDKTKKYPQHFNHQSREHLFMRAMLLLCETQKEHPDCEKWEASMKLYAQYLKDLMAYSAPYGLVPSGVYSLEETKDADLFIRMNMGCKYEEEYENWVEQIKSGVKLSDTFYVRCHPVWFSFRGNAAVQLESGKAASMLGNYFGDSELLQIALEQFYWICGKNPFVQSIIYGHGTRYCQQYALSSGELCGEMPVGMESYGNTDEPYWPQGNNCTYKEIWTSPSRSLLWMLADLW